MSQQPYYPQPQYQMPVMQQPQPPVDSLTDPGLNQPWYGIGFIPALIRPFKKYADFSGRASRGEYWWFYLGTAIVYFVLTILLFAAGIDWQKVSAGSYSGTGLNGFGTFLIILLLVFGLGLFIPMLALSVRRLHDTNKAGAYYCMSFIPYAGPIILIVFMAIQTYPYATQWDNPKPGVGSAGGYGQGFLPVAPAPAGYPSPAAPQAYPPVQYPTAPYPQAAPYPPTDPYQGYQP